jgi:DNA-binding ferritin-like protein (Dps family)
MPTIFTLNSRSHVMLEVMRDHYGVTAPHMRREIQGLHGKLINILNSKGIKYEDLRVALVPVMDRQEAAFIFDSTAFDSSFYGREIFNHVLPLLEPNATQSILVGDLLGDDQQFVLEILRESMTLSRSFSFKHSTLLYCVYINNLSDTALQRLHEGLAGCQAYLGHIPTTFGSRAKTYISLSVCSFILKRGKTLIVAHEDDRDNAEDINITFYPLENFDYKVV